MEFVQFHPTGMVWPPSVKGILVTESVRGDGGVLRNSEGKRFMFDHIPDVFKEKYAQSEREADGWYEDPDHRRPPELFPATRWPARSTPSTRPDAAPRTAGSSSTCPPDAAEVTRRGCPRCITS